MGLCVTGIREPRLSIHTRHRFTNPTSEARLQMSDKGANLSSPSRVYYMTVIHV